MTTDADEIPNLYERHAAAFDRRRSRALFEKGWLDLFLQAMGIGASVLDLGCGSGEPMARYLIRRECAVTGVDTAASLVALCQERFPDEHWIIGDMRQISLGPRFDGALAWDSFFHLTAADQRAMFSIFEMHVAQGGALMFTSGPKAGEALGSFEGETLYHASLDPAEYRALLDRHGFDALAHIAEDPDCGGHTVWLARKR
jgi:SAM-dependent methyltransferase